MNPDLHKWLYGDPEDHYIYVGEQASIRVEPESTVYTATIHGLTIYVVDLPSTDERIIVGPMLEDL